MRLLKAFWDWLRGKTDKEQIKELKEALPEKPPIIKELPPPPIRKGTLQDIRAYTEEARKTIWILKKALNDHYQELGNLKDKIDRLIERQK
ncbi:hypothetical protein ES703_73320 [subsurface metagenome]